MIKSEKGINSSAPLMTSQTCGLTVFPVIKCSTLEWIPHYTCNATTMKTC